MVIPDFELICEIMLVAEGFIDARLLARKFISLYTLCKELLSKQVHTLNHFLLNLQSTEHLERNSCYSSQCGDCYVMYSQGIVLAYTQKHDKSTQIPCV